jgi:hypothetical protein
MKQSAVEWLQEQIECFGNKHELQMSWSTLDELLEKAKAMEKEQMWNYIKTNYVSGEFSLAFHKKEFEQYYQKNYKEDKQ